MSEKTNRVVRNVGLPAPLWLRVKRACLNREEAGQPVTQFEWIEEAVRAQLEKDDAMIVVPRQEGED